MHLFEWLGLNLVTSSTASSSCGKVMGITGHLSDLTGHTGETMLQILLGRLHPQADTPWGGHQSPPPQVTE